MPGCSAPNCRNSNRKGFRMFVFPSNEERRKKWIANCGLTTATFTLSRNVRLCEAHFEESQFELKRQDGWKRLKCNAEPTLFDAPNPQEEQVVVQMRTIGFQIDLGDSDESLEDWNSQNSLNLNPHIDENNSFVVDDPDPCPKFGINEGPTPAKQICPVHKVAVINPTMILQARIPSKDVSNGYDTAAVASSTATTTNTLVQCEQSPEDNNNDNDTNDEIPRVCETYSSAPQGEKKTDEFDAYGEYIAKLLRSLDRSTRAFLKKDFGEAIFKAESGWYASNSGPNNISFSPQVSSPAIITASQYESVVSQQILPAHEPVSEKLELVWGEPSS